MKNLLPMNLQLFAEPADSADGTEQPTQQTPDGADKQPSGEGGQQQPEAKPVVMTQAQLDEIINKAFARGAAKGEKKAAAAQQGTPENGAPVPDQTNVSAELEAERAKAQGLERRLSAMTKGVPPDKADKYARLAETYLGDDGDFNKALDAAIADFPFAQQTSPPAGGAFSTGGVPKGEKLPGQISAERKLAQQVRAAEAEKKWTAK